MPPVIRISDSIFKRLQAPDLATALVDTPASVIEKLLDFYEERRPELKDVTNRPDRITSNGDAVVFDADSPPDLTHTRVLAAEFAGCTASSWNDLVKVAHRCSLEHFNSFETLRSSTQSNVVKGRRTDSGFHYVADLNISIQYAEANRAWPNTLHLARKLGVPVSVHFEWREKDNGHARKGVLASMPAPTQSHSSRHEQRQL